MRRKEKPGVIIYWSSFDSLQGLDPERFKEMFLAIRNYSQYGEVPDFGDDPFLLLLWPMIKSGVDKDTANYEGKRRTNQKSGLASEFVRIYAPAHGIDPTDEAAKAEYIKRRLAEIETEEVNER